MSSIVIFIIVGIVAICVMFFDSVQKNKQYQIESDKFLSNINFLISKRITIDLTGQIKLEFLVDDENKKFAILSCKPNTSFISGQESFSQKNFSINIFDFTDITNFELLLDNDSLLQGKGLMTTGGALLFGVAGAIIGSSGERDIQKKNRAIILNIYLNKIDCPVITINFPIIKNSDSLSNVVYETVLANAQEIKGVLHYIQQQNNNANNTKNTFDEGNDITSKIKQLNELKEQNLITEEEFNNKKKNLLDNL